MAVNDWIYEVSLASLIPASLVVFCLVLWQRRVRQQALLGDLSAAPSVVLPFYEQYMLLFLVVLCLHVVVLLVPVFVFDHGPSPLWVTALVGTAQGLWSLVGQEGLAFFLSRRSLSWAAWWSAIRFVIPYGVVVALLFGSNRYFMQRDVWLAALLGSVYYTAAIVFYAVLLARYRHRRAGLIVPFCVVHIGIHAISAAYLLVFASQIEWLRYSVGIVYITLSTSDVFIFYYTIRRDTKYWRGIGTVEELPLTKKFRTSRYATLSNPLEAGTVTALPENSAGNLVQVLIHQNRMLTIDFAFLEFKEPIAQGSTSVVYRGRVKGREDVAIKVFTPLEVTEETVLAYERETKLASNLEHPNIVKYYGL